MTHTTYHNPYTNPKNLQVSFKNLIYSLNQSMKKKCMHNNNALNEINFLTKIIKNSTELA